MMVFMLIVIGNRQAGDIMSGLKYTPERAKQAADQERARQIAYQRHLSSKGGNSSGRGCLVFIVISAIFVVSVYAWGYFSSESNSYDEEKASITKYVCNEIYSVSYGELESSSFNNDTILKMSNKALQKEYMISRKIEVSHPIPSDNIKEGVEYKKVIVTIDNATIGKIVNEYAAIPNEDGSFTLEPMSDFQNRMHK